MAPCNSESNGIVNYEQVTYAKKHQCTLPNLTVAEAAAQINASYLNDFLLRISAVFEKKEDIQLRRFLDFFEDAFSCVTASKFPWIRLFREVPLLRTIDVPLCHLSDEVLKISVDWINHRSLEAVSHFLLWSLDGLLVSLKRKLVGVKKTVQQVAMFICLAMILRQKPDALISVLPTLMKYKIYQGQDKIPLFTWMIAQASVGDISVGLYAWSRIVVGESGNPQSSDLVLQLVEKILSTPKASLVLVNGAVRKGERLIPPPAFETLIRVSFPSSNRSVMVDTVQAKERFALIYPILRKVALCGSHELKAIQQIFSFAIEAAGEDNPELSKEAIGIVIWCFCRSTECYKQWKKVYKGNIVASVAVLKTISDDWKVQSTKLSPYEPLAEIVKHFRQKNERALATETDAARHAHFKDADKYCKKIAGRVSKRRLGCKALLIIALGLSVFINTLVILRLIQFNKVY